MTRLILLEAALRVKTTTVLLAAGAAGAAFLVAGGATAAQPGVDSATGGGQVLIGDGGAGDTIAFTARGTADGASGQVQYVDRTGGTGQGQTVDHGTVECIEVDGNTARISGTWNDGEGAFSLFVVDNGQGSAAEDDIVTVTRLTTPQCGDDFEDPDNRDALARGNVQVNDGA